jgi:protein ImuB
MERISLLYECGLQTIGQLLELPRASLPSRFGPELLLRLDQAFGTAEELLEPDLPPVPIRQQLKFEYPLTEPDEVLQVLRQLLKEVLDQLTARRRETQQVTCGWGTEASDAGTFDIRMLRPTIQFERLWELLTLKLETMQLAAGLMTLWLEAVPCSPQSPRRTTLFEEEGPGSAEFLRLVERLSSRLGEQAVIRYSRIAESQPELSCVAEPWLSSTQESISDEVPTRAVVPRRPLRLLASPVRLRVMTRSSREGLLQFRWQDREYKVAQLHGPERIVTGWWRTGMIRRDYYRVETTTGARFWLFRECQSGHWFLQGVFE